MILEPRYLRPMDQTAFNGFMLRGHVSYVTLDMRIIHLFTVRLLRSNALLRWHVQHMTAALTFIERLLFKDKLQI